jgi:hypothetical protein
MSRRTIETEVARHFGVAEEEILEKRSDSAFKVLRFFNNPTDGLTSLVTCGLSGMMLTQSSGEKSRPLRQELVVSFPSQFDLKPQLDALFSIAESAIENGRAFEFGETVKLGFQASAGSRLDGFLCIEPPFWEHEEESSTLAMLPIIFVYLMPIFSDELVALRRLGIQRFLSMIEDHDIDIVDPERPHLV